MPVILPESLPAYQVLKKEDLPVMSKDTMMSAISRNLHIVIVNLMPNKTQTENQLLRLLAFSFITVHPTLIHMKSHQSKNTPLEHLQLFYKTFDRIRDDKFDGMIITGAPVEQIPFEQVDYWQELIQIMDWSRTNVRSTLHICWGAQAALYHHFQIQKRELTQKIFGVYQHTITNSSFLTKGFAPVFPVPHSRYTEINREELERTQQVKILSESEEAGVYLVSSLDKKLFFVTGHPEYENTTLRDEYLRDLAKGIPIDLPKHYFPDDDPKIIPEKSWGDHARQLYLNWISLCKP